MNEDPKVLYVVGAGRSGSTVLGTLLGELHGFVNVGEFRRAWTTGWRHGGLCGCGDPVPECGFWKRVRDEAIGSDPAAFERLLENRSAFVSGRGYGAPATEFAEAHARLYRAAAAVSGARVVVDVSKSPAEAELLAGTTGIRASFLHLVRDPRAVAFSFSRLKATPGHHRFMRQASPWRSARDWALRNLRAARIRRRTERSALLRYEDFCVRPLETLEDLTGLVGERAAGLEVAEDGAFVVHRQHTAAGNADRFQTGPVRIQEDDEWRHAQRPGDQLLVTAITLPFLRGYGYPIRVRSREPHPGMMREAP